MVGSEQHLVEALLTAKIHVHHLVGMTPQRAQLIEVKTYQVAPKLRCVRAGNPLLNQVSPGSYAKEAIESLCVSVGMSSGVRQQSHYGHV